MLSACEREVHMTKEYRATTKEDKSPLDTQEVIDRKYKE